MREGLLPHTITTVLTLETTEASARAATEQLGEMFDPYETAVAAFEDEATGRWKLEAYFASPPDEETVRAVIALAVGDAEAQKAVFETVSAKDWVASSLEGLKPVEAGRFIIHGSHDRAKVERLRNRIGIEIEAGLAFGTGHHGTTRGCLLAMDALFKRRKPQRILDIGTGTGLLAIGAARALKRTIVASDIDPIAVAVARDNARLNHASAFIRFAVAPGLRHQTIAARKPYDLIVANILARPLMRLAPEVAGALALNGTLILSGLLEKDVTGILAAYRACGITLVSHGHLEGWVALVMKKGGAGHRPHRP